MKVRAAAMLALLLAAPAVARPSRIVSLNPCVDAVLMRVADAGQIAAISQYSHDARASSIPLSLARRFPVTSGTAEEVLAMRPDLVIAGPHVSLPTITALQRMNIPLMRIGVAASIAESRGQIMELARAIGDEKRGAKLNAEIAAALRAASSTGPSVTALIWMGGGLVPGTGTLADELLAATGFRNLSKDYGLKAWDVLPLEYLLDRPPEVLLTSGGERENRDRILTHPAVRRLSKYTEVAEFAPRLLHCAGPTIIEAAARLKQIRQIQENRR